MDSGCLELGELMDQDFDMERGVLPEELIWLMDELLNREVATPAIATASAYKLQVAWLMGYPLSQTLFTSVHIDRLLWPDPKSLEECTFTRGQAVQALPLAQKILRTYCLLIIKTCDLVLGMVTSQHYYEGGLIFAIDLFRILTFSRRRTSQLSFLIGNYCTDSQAKTSQKLLLSL